MHPTAEAATTDGPDPVAAVDDDPDDDGPDDEDTAPRSRGPVHPVWEGTTAGALTMMLAALPVVLPTAGLAGFWTGAAQRRRQWEDLSIFGEPFQWLGSGAERLRRWAAGAVLALLAIAAVYAGALLLVLQAGSHRYWLADLAGLAALVVAWRVARLRTTRHLLTRTRLVEHTGRMTDPLPIALLRDAGLALAVLATAGLAWPWAAAKRLHVRLNRVWIGERKLNVGRIDPRPLYRPFLPLWAVTIGAGTGLAVAVWPSLTAGIAALAPLDDPLATVSSGQAVWAALRVGAPALAALAGWLLLCTALAGAWRGWLWQAAAAATSIGGYGFRFTPRPLTLAAAALLDPLLSLATLGLARPPLRHLWAGIAADGLSSAPLDHDPLADGFGAAVPPTAPARQS